MNIKNPKDCQRTLEIYEYYDGPLSSLVEFKDGSKALVEVRDWEHNVKCLWELVTLCNDEDIARLKSNTVALRDFILNKATASQVILWHHHSQGCSATYLSKEETLPHLEGMSDQFIFKDTSKNWTNYV